VGLVGEDTMETEVIPEGLRQKLSSQIPDDPTMTTHAIEIDGYRYQIAERLVDARRKLTEDENRYKMIKSKTYTEFDRKMYMSDMTKEQRAMVELLEITLQTIDKRINLIQSMLRIMTEEYKRSGDGRI
jgi:hypothetical protein